MERRLTRRAWLKRGGLALSGAALAGGLIDYFQYPWGAPVQGKAGGEASENGVWLRYTHYFGEKRDDELVALARSLAARKIRWAYFHVRFIERSGRLHFRYPAAAQRLLAIVRRENPALHCLAWVYAGNARGEGNVDLTRPEVRATMVGEARWLCETCGFDGIQWDYEICPDGDEGLLSLLRETRAALGPKRPISVCAPAWLPLLAGRYGWSERYISRVAAHCDQVAVMAYDTGFVTPRAYVWLVAKNVALYTRAVRTDNPGATVMLGVPTYGPGFRSHNPHAENLENSLRGVRLGLTASDAVPDALVGVAPFADYTTDDDEWRLWERLWLGR